MSKVFTYQDLEAHKDRENLYLTIHGKVYDVAAFLDEHPGGDEVLLEEAGRDATEAFEDVGHSDEARDMLVKMLVGTLAEGENEKAKRSTGGSSTSASTQGGSSPVRFLPLVVLIAAYLYWRFFLA